MHDAKAWSRIPRALVALALGRSRMASFTPAQPPKYGLDGYFKACDAASPGSRMAKHVPTPATTRMLV